MFKNLDLQEEEVLRGLHYLLARKTKDTLNVTANETILQAASKAPNICILLKDSFPHKHRHATHFPKSFMF